MTLVLVLGAGFGGGVMCLAYGLRPRRVALATALVALRGAAPTPVPGRQRLYSTIAGPLQRLGLPRPRVRADLALLERDTAEYLAIQTATTLLGLLGGPLIVSVYGLSNATAPLWLGLVGAAIGYRWTELKLRNDAAKKRKQLHQTMTTMMVMISICLAGGDGVEQATGESAAICRGWAADRLRRILIDPTGISRRTAWSSLAELGQQADIPALVNLASPMRLAGDDGARIRDTLTERADALRDEATSAAELEAAKTSSKLTLPVAIFGFTLLLFLIFPPLYGLAESFK